MQLLFLNGIGADQWIHALCWTLLHSLWQGLMLAILGAAVIILTRKSSPQLRYNILTGLFVLFIIGSAATFTWLLLQAGTAPPITGSYASPITISEAGTQTGIIQSSSPHQSFFEDFAGYLDKNSMLIVAVWYILFSAKLVRVICNILYAQRIRKHGVSAPADYWKDRLIALAQTLRLSQHIRLLESALINVPVVVGMFKPIILVPLGLLAKLPPEHVEAILLHELAHIRRKDYFVNLLQHFAEIIFFFNPAVLWISSLIREEREHCCDDIAIQNINSKKVFVHALVAFQEYALHHSNKSIAIAFAGRKKYLLNRVKRIIYNENKKLNAMEKGIFIFSIFAISLAGFVSVKQTARNTAVQGPVKKLSENQVALVSPTKRIAIIDTVPFKTQFKIVGSYTNEIDDKEVRTVTATANDNTRYKIIFREGAVAELYINEKRIPESEMDKYKTTVESIEKEIERRQNKDVELMKKDQSEQTEKLEKLEIERNELLERLKLLDEQRAHFNYDKRKEMDDHEWENAARQNLFKEQQYKMLNDPSYDRKAMELFKEQKLWQEKGLLKETQELDELKQQKMNLLNEFNNSQNKLEQKLNDFKYENQLQLLKEQSFLYQSENSFALIDPVIQNLVADGLLPAHEEDLSFELTDQKLIVNGKKQPAEIHDRYKKKFLKTEGDFFKYSKKGESRSTSIKVQ